MTEYTSHRIRVEKRFPGVARFTRAAGLLGAARFTRAACFPGAARLLRRAVACSLLTIAFPVFSQSPATGPFMQRDQFPVRMLFLGLRPDAGDLLPLRSARWAVRFDYANTYASTLPVGDTLIADDYYRAAPANEYRLFVDSETLRVSVDLDWRIASRVQIGATMPFLKHGGGFLDGAWRVPPHSTCPMGGRGRPGTIMGIRRRDAVFGSGAWSPPIPRCSVAYEGRCTVTVGLTLFLCGL